MMRRIQRTCFGVLLLVVLFGLPVAVPWTLATAQPRFEKGRADHPASLAGVLGDDCPAGTSLIAKFEVHDDGTFVFEQGAYPGAVTLFNVQTKPGEPDEPISAEFSSTVPVGAVYVKAGPNSKTDTYAPPVTSGSFDNWGLGDNNPAISNVSFCGLKTADVELDLQPAFSGDPTPGQVIDFTIVVFNNPMDGDPIQDGFANPGQPWPFPVAATGVEVRMVVLGDSLHYVPGSASGGTASGDTLTFYIDHLDVGHHPPAPGDLVTVSFQAQVAWGATAYDAGDVCTEVFVMAPDIDPDSDPANMTVVAEVAYPEEDEEDHEYYNRLPVELTAFDAVLDGNAALLTWTTASETNNAGFEVQRTLQVQTPNAEIQRGPWEVLGFVEGAGTTLQAQTYGYRVDDLQPGRHLFRLKQIDYDGTFAYSPEVGVEVDLATAYYLSPAYPNPCNPSTRFTLTLARAQQVRVEVFDVLGRRVAMLYDGPLTADTAHGFTLETAGLPSGRYTYRIMGETFVAQDGVIVMK